MRNIFAFLGLFALGCTATQPKLEFADWTKAFEHAKAGHTVRLTLEDVSTPNDTPFTVYLIDNQSVAYKHVVASLAFYGQNPASFMVDVSPVLNRLDGPPSSETVILLECFKNEKVTYKSIKIELVK
jgi:hypothetical protein